MAVNKNFVVKNGLEVNTDLILANAETTQVGIATTAPEYTLHINGGIGATDSYVSAASTVLNNFQVGLGGSVFTVVDAFTGIGSVGVGTVSPEYLLDIRSPVSTGQTALYVQGDMRVTGDINLDDITLDDATIQNLTVSDTFKVVGLSTFEDYVDINDSVDISQTLNVSGITTLASSGGITTTGGDLYVGGDLFVKDDIVYDEVTGRNLNITGIATIGTVDINAGDIEVSNVDTSELYVSGIGTINGVKIGQPAGIITAASASGIVTYYGDGSRLSGIATNLTATIGISSGGTHIGSGITAVDFTATNATITVAVPPDTAAGIATVNIQPSVSLGLVIALGG